MGRQRKAERGRFSAKRKRDTVVRLLRGEDLDTLSRELGVTAATLSSWRDTFLVGGEASLKTRERDDRDAEVTRLKTAVGDLTMRNELLREANQRLRDGLPLAPGRSRR